MSGPVALVGGGEWRDGCDFDAELVNQVGAEEVVVVPAGAAFESVPKTLARAEAWFAGLGVAMRAVPVTTRTDGLDADVLATVRQARFLYLPGNSPMHLRSVLKDSPLYDAVVEAWRAGAALAGSGAGADVLCDPMVDTRGGAFTVGLGLVPGLAVIPRANQWSPDKIHRTVELAPTGLVVAALPEATALIGAPGVPWRSAGVGECTVFRDGAPTTLDALAPMPA